MAKLSDIFSMGVPGLFGSSSKGSPADEAMPYLQQIPGMAEQYLSPYMQMGQQAGETLMPQFQQMAQDPVGMMAGIGAQYQESPAFQAQMRLMDPERKAAAAAGGYAGTDLDEMKRMQLAQALASSDYYNWLGNVLGQQQTGLAGLGGFQQQGYGAGTGMADIGTQALGSMAGLSYMDKAAEQQRQSDLQKSLLGLGGAALGTLFGPAGTAIGGAIGDKVGGFFSK